MRIICTYCSGQGVIGVLATEMGNPSAFRVERFMTCPKCCGQRFVPLQKKLPTSIEMQCDMPDTVFDSKQVE